MFVKIYNSYKEHEVVFLNLAIAFVLILLGQTFSQLLTSNYQEGCYLAAIAITFFLYFFGKYFGKISYILVGIVAIFLGLAGFGYLTAVISLLFPSICVYLSTKLDTNRLFQIFAIALVLQFITFTWFMIAHTQYIIQIASILLFTSYSIIKWKEYTDKRDSLDFISQVIFYSTVIEMSFALLLHGNLSYITM